MAKKFSISLGNVYSTDCTLYWIKPSGAKGKRGTAIGKKIRCQHCTSLYKLLDNSSLCNVNSLNQKPNTDPSNAHQNRRTSWIRIISMFTLTALNINNIDIASVCFEYTYYQHSLFAANKNITN